MSKIYKTGFYGGKFFPFHQGHFYCLTKMASECEDAVLIMFVNGKDETSYSGEKHDFLSVEERIKKINKIVKNFPNVRFTTLYCDVIYDGEEVEADNWKKEAPYVRAVVGSKFDAVYSSEKGYDAFFKEVYPFAHHRIVDVDRKEFPISATQIRENPELYKKWEI